MQKHIIPRILLFAISILFALLVLALLIPLSYGSAEAYIGQASLQLARSNGFAKNALILEFGPADKQTQALSDLQVALPLFVNEQAAIQRNSNTNVQAILLQAQGNYLALVASVTELTSQASVDPKQVAIVIDSSRAYNTAMNQYLSALQQQANDFNMHLVLFQEVITALIIVCFVWLQWLCRPRKEP